MLTSVILYGCAASNAEWLHPKFSKSRTQKDLSDCKMKSKMKEPGAKEVLIYGVAGAYAKKAIQ